MDERKTNYLKELKSNTSFFTTALTGVVLGLILFLLDKFNMPGKLLARFGLTAKFSSVVIPALYGLLFTAIAFVILIVLAKVLRKTWQREDTLLVSYDFFALTVLLGNTIGLDEGSGKVTFGVVLFVLGALLTIARALRITEAEPKERETLPMVEYKEAIVKRYGFPYLVVAGVVLGVAIGLILHFVDVDAIVGSVFSGWADLTKMEKIGYVAGIGGALAVALNLYTICNYRKAKVTCLDANLVIMTIASFFAGVFFALNQDRFAWHYHSWYLITLILAGTLIIRSVNVDAKTEDKKYNKVTLYFLALARKLSVGLMLAVAVVVAGSLIKLDAAGFANAFKDGNGVFTIVGLGGSLAIVVMAIESLIRDKLTAKNVTLLDFALCVSFMISGIMLFDLIGGYSVAKLVIFLVAFVVVAFLLVRRILASGFANEEVIEVVTEEPEEHEELFEEEVSEAEETVEEPEEVEEAVEETVMTADPEEELVADGDKLVIRRTRFVNKMKFTSDTTKQYYTEIKNLLLSYGAKSKISRRNEAFRKSGLIAKISLSGRSLRLHLPLDPNDEERFPTSKYHQTSLLEKKQFSEVPFTIKIKSNRGLKRALELVEMVCLEKPLKKKRKFEAQDFTADLEVNGEAIFDKLDLSDKLTDHFDKEYLAAFKNETPEETLTEMMELIPNIEKTEPRDGEIQNIYIDTVLDKLEGDVISLETLKDVNIISKATNNICVKIHDELDRPIRVECDEITPEAALAVLALNGKVFLKK